MRIYDITAPLSPSLPVYPGDPEVTITPIAQLQWGDAANVSRLVTEFAYWDASRRATPLLRGGPGD